MNISFGQCEFQNPDVNNLLFRSDYADAFKASLNFKKFMFTAPLTDVSQIGRGNDLCK
jgi:hypothetical protein